MKLQGKSVAESVAAVVAGDAARADLVEWLLGGEHSATDIAVYAAGLLSPEELGRVIEAQTSRVVATAAAAAAESAAAKAKAEGAAKGGEYGGWRRNKSGGVFWGGVASGGRVVGNCSVHAVCGLVAALAGLRDMLRDGLAAGVVERQVEFTHQHGRRKGESDTRRQWFAGELKLSGKSQLKAEAAARADLEFLTHVVTALEARADLASGAAEAAEA